MIDMKSPDVPVDILLEDKLAIIRELNNSTTQLSKFILQFSDVRLRSFELWNFYIDANDHAAQFSDFFLQFSNDCIRLIELWDRFLTNRYRDLDRLHVDISAREPSLHDSQDSDKGKTTEAKE